MTTNSFVPGWRKIVRKLVGCSVREEGRSRKRRTSKARGYGTAELLVSGFVGLTGGALATAGFIALYTGLSGQRSLSHAVDEARLAMEVVTNQILPAGAGLPRRPVPIPAFEEMESTSLVFRGNVRGVTTVLSEPALVGTSTIALASVEGFGPGDVVYVVWDDVWHEAGITSIEGTALTISPGIQLNFPAGSLVQVVEEVRLEYIGDTLFRNGKRLIGNLDALTFSYDAEDPARVRTVAIDLTVRTVDAEAVAGEPRLVNLSGRVTPPNLKL